MCVITFLGLVFVHKAASVYVYFPKKSRAYFLRPATTWKESLCLNLKVLKEKEVKEKEEGEEERLGGEES